MEIRVQRLDPELPLPSAQHDHDAGHDLHAREDMQPNALDLAIDDHIYFSKEASSGGRGFAGGGCGCN